MKAPWRKVKAACEKKGLRVFPHGSEHIVKGVGVDGGMRSVVIGHECSRSPSADVWDDYIASLRRTFGFTNEDFR